MHKAPSVTYPVGPCAWYGRVLWVAMSVVALAGALSAVLGQPPQDWGLAAAVVLAACSVFAVAVHLSNWPAGRLTWRLDEDDPALGEWVWQPHTGRAVLVDVKVVWTGSTCLGLRLVNGQGHSQWVWAQAHQAPLDWLSFRRALISSVNS